jgi:hypothetical protein
MNVLSRFVVILVLLFGCTLGAMAQSDLHGAPASLLKSGIGSTVSGSSSTSSFPLAGPLYPPPLGLNFLSTPGTPGAAGRLGGNNWYFSGVNISGLTQTYWGAIPDGALLSLDGFSFTSAESLDVSFVSLAGGVVVWSGTSQFWDKSTGFGPFFIGVSFVLTVTDSITGSPVPLVAAASVGLPSSVGAVVPVTPGLHYRANLQFMVSGTPALDWFDTYADGTHGPAASSFTAGFYWSDIVIDPLNFGNVLVGDFPIDSMTIHNYSLVTRTITAGAVSTDPNFSPLGFSSTPIASFDSAKFAVQFTAVPGPQGGSIMFAHDGVSSPDSGAVTGTGVMRIVVDKFQDADGNAGTTGDLSAHQWHLALYADSVSLVSLLAQATATQLIVDDLAAGTYIAVEADSGASWQRLNGNGTFNDTITLFNTPVTVDSFINFRPSQLTVRKYQDNDGGLATSGDRVLKAWHLEIHSGSPGGPLVGSTNGSSLTVGGLGDGTYYAVESDSATWVHLGYLVDGSPTASSDTAVAVVLTNGQVATVDFINAPPIYGTTYRSFNADSLALDVDNKGKVNKPVKRKAVRVEFCAHLPNGTLGADGLHAEFSAAIDTSFPFYTVPASTKVGDAKLKKWDFTFSNPVPVGDTVKVFGFGKIGKAIKVSKYFWRVGLLAGPSLKNPLIDPNQPRNPMPNRVNGLQDAYALGAFTSTLGLQVGKNRAGVPDSSKWYGWVIHKKYGDVLKTLYVSKQVPHTHDGAAAGFNFVKKQSKLPKTKQNNKLLSNMVALKLNIAMSEKGITPPGLGDLLYDDGGVNPMNGKSINAISQIADSLVMGYYLASVHQFGSAGMYDTLFGVLRDLNDAFEGPLDTLSFAGPLEYTGVRALYEVPYLHADTSFLPSQIRPTPGTIVEVPERFELYANYPNPFNPSTTIEFSLSSPSLVTLKVYDILGREVATLIDRGMYEEGADEVTFDASQLASGVYLYRLVVQPLADEEDGSAASPVTFVRKMMLLK